jgi:hypothetical protein
MGLKKWPTGRNAHSEGVHGGTFLWKYGECPYLFWGMSLLVLLIVGSFYGGIVMSILKAAMWVHGNTVVLEKFVNVLGISGTYAVENIVCDVDLKNLTDQSDRFSSEIVEAINLMPHPQGSGSTFNASPNTSYWFHFGIPAPVILDNAQTLLSKVFVFYQTKGWTKVTNIHVYDGPSRVKTFDGLQLSGDFSNGIHAENQWELSPPSAIKFGLGISICVQFGPSSTDGLSIKFTSAGADFYTA